MWGEKKMTLKNHVHVMAHKLKLTYRTTFVIIFFIQAFGKSAAHHSIHLLRLHQPTILRAFGTLIQENVSLNMRDILAV